MEEVWVDYTHGSISDNITLTLVGGYWMGTIYLDDTLDKLTYKIHLFDPKGEYNGTGPYNVTIRDNDLPFFGLDETPYQEPQEMTSHSSSGRKTSLNLIRSGWNTGTERAPMRIYP